MIASTALRHPNCRHLAELCGKLVDAPKTGDEELTVLYLVLLLPVYAPPRRVACRCGVAAQIREDLKGVRYPHYMKTGTRGTTGYQRSTSILGKLFDATNTDVAEAAAGPPGSSGAVASSAGAAAQDSASSSTSCSDSSESLARGSSWDVAMREGVCRGLRLPVDDDGVICAQVGTSAGAGGYQQPQMPAVPASAAAAILKGPHPRVLEVAAARKLVRTPCTHAVLVPLCFGCLPCTLCQGLTAGRRVQDWARCSPEALKLLERFNAKVTAHIEQIKALRIADSHEYVCGACPPRFANVDATLCAARAMQEASGTSRHRCSRCEQRAVGSACACAGCECC